MIAESPQRRDFLLKLGVTLLAAACSLYGFTAKSLWFDEVRTWVMTRDVAALRETFTTEANMWAYYLLCFAWTRMGDSEAWLRSLPALLNVLAVWPLMALGARLFGTRAGRWAGLFFALHGAAATFAQLGRGYSLMLLLSALATLAFIDLVQTSRRSPPLWYACWSILGLQTHFFFALVCAAHIFSLLTLPPRTWPWRRLLVAAGLIGSASLILFSLQPLANPQIDWITPISAATAHELAWLVTGTRSPWSWVVALGLLHAGLRAAMLLWRTPRSPSAWAWMLTLSWLLLPVLVVLLASAVWRPIFQTRYLAPVILPTALLLAAGLPSLPRGWLTHGAVVLTAAALFSGVWHYQRAPARQDWRGLTEHIHLASKPGDAIIFFTYFLEPCFRYYAERSPAGPWPHVVPATLAPYSLSGGSRMPDPRPDLGPTLARDYTRVWWVLGHQDFSRLGRDRQARQIHELLSSAYRLVSTQRWGTIQSMLWIRKSDLESIN